MADAARRTGDLAAKAHRDEQLVDGLARESRVELTRRSAGVPTAVALAE